MSNQQLFQVHVTDRQDKDVAIGPLVNLPDVLGPLVESINIAVAAGKERNWRDARVEKVVKLAN
jgi:hypothetical protein